MSADDVYAVKVKGPGDRVWRFLTPEGGETRTRFHAAMIQAKDGKTAKERAEGFAAYLVSNEPDYQARAVPFWKGAGA